MKKLVIRAAHLKDAEDLAQFNLGLAREAHKIDLDYSTVLSGVKRLISKPEYGFYTVAELDGKVAASIMITYEWTDWRDGIFWWVQSVYTRPEFRKRGIYQQLYAHIRSMAKADKDVRGLKLYVEQDNKVAQQSYRRAGMQETHDKLFAEYF